MVDWGLLLDNWRPLLAGLRVTIEVSACALLLAFTLGTIVATLRVAPSRALQAVGTAYVEFVRNVPLLVQIFFFYFGLPSIGIRFSAFECGFLALGIYTAAFIAETIRGGILAVHRGQMEAALASGLSYMLVMRLVILPQAIRAVIPPLGNQTLNLIKNSSLVSTIAVYDVLHSADSIGSQTFQYSTAYAAAAILYLCLTLPSAYAVNRLERRMKIASVHVG
ncbi:MAG: amino acid ABC transporter permease [Vulcanimicrobiaceae bacterium]